MRRYLMVTVAWVVTFSTMARADIITLDCEVTFDLSGNQRHRQVSIDLDHRTVRDEDLAWTNGARVPGPGAFEQWVRMDGHVASWGERRTNTGEPSSVFELDLQTGRYALTSTANGRVSHGTCAGFGLTS